MSEYNAATFDYFKCDSRTGEVEDDQVIPILSKVYNQIFPQSGETLFKLENKYTDASQYPLIKEIKSQMDTSKTLDIENVLCDEVFAEYLLTVKKLVNAGFFERLVMFVFLYWENINSVKKAESGEDNYTSKHNAEDAPDVSNEFITEFLESETGIGLFEKDEAIKLTQNFCQWMYDSNYTCSKLTLINN